MKIDEEKIPEEKYQVKLGQGDFFSLYQNDRREFMTRLKLWNKLKLDAFIPDENFRHENFNKIKMSFNIPLFPLLISHPLKLIYKKFFKSFIIKDYIQYRIILFASIETLDNFINLYRVKFKKSDLKLLWLKNESLSLDQLKEKFNIIILKTNLAESFYLDYHDTWMILKIAHDEDLCGYIDIDYNIKTKLFEDVEFVRCDN